MHGMPLRDIWLYNSHASLHVILPTTCLCHLVLPQVDAPSDSSGNAAAAAAASSTPRLLLEAASPGTQPLAIREVLGKLRTYTQEHNAHGVVAGVIAPGKGASAAASSTSNAAAAAAGSAAAAAARVFPYELLQVVSSEELQAAGSGRFTRHVELELPEGMTYTAGERRCCLYCAWCLACFGMFVVGTIKHTTSALSTRMPDFLQM
jgi:hypothetical protein